MEEQNNNNMMENNNEEMKKTPEGMGDMPTPEQTTESMPTTEGEQKPIGSIVGIIIIIVIIIIGGLYFWRQKVVVDEVDVQLTEDVVSETADIEADLQGLDTASLDAELENIDTELGI